MNESDMDGNRLLQEEIHSRDLSDRMDQEQERDRKRMESDIDNLLIKMGRGLTSIDDELEMRELLRFFNVSV